MRASFGIRAAVALQPNFGCEIALTRRSTRPNRAIANTRRPRPSSVLERQKGASRRIVAHWVRNRKRFVDGAGARVDLDGVVARPSVRFWGRGWAVEFAARRGSTVHSRSTLARMRTLPRPSAKPSRRRGAPAVKSYPSSSYPPVVRGSAKQSTRLVGYDCVATQFLAARLNF